MAFLYGVVATLLVESLALMIATAWMRREIHEHK